MSDADSGDESGSDDDFMPVPVHRAKQKGADMVRNTKNNKIDTAAAAVMFGLGLVLPIGGLKGFWDAGFQATMSAEDWKKTKGFAIYSTFVTIQSMDASIRMLEKTGGGLPPHRWKKLKPYPGGKSSYFSKDYDMQYIIDRFNKRALKATQAREHSRGLAHRCPYREPDAGASLCCFAPSCSGFVPLQQSPRPTRTFRVAVMHSVHLRWQPRRP